MRLSHLIRSLEANLPLYYTRAKIQSRPQNWSRREKRSISINKNDPSLFEISVVLRVLGHPVQKGYYREGLEAGEWQRRQRRRRWRRRRRRQPGMGGGCEGGWTKLNSRWRVSDLSRKTRRHTTDEFRMWRATTIVRARLLLLYDTPIITNSGKITHRTKENRDVALRAPPFARVWTLRGVYETAREGRRPLPPQRSTEIAERGRARPNVGCSADIPNYRRSGHISNAHCCKLSFKEKLHGSDGSTVSKVNAFWDSWIWQPIHTAQNITAILLILLILL